MNMINYILSYTIIFAAIIFNICFIYPGQKKPNLIIKSGFSYTYILIGGLLLIIPALAQTDFSQLSQFIWADPQICAIDQAKLAWLQKVDPQLCSNPQMLIETAKAISENSLKNITNTIGINNSYFSSHIWNSSLINCKLFNSSAKLSYLHNVQFVNSVVYDSNLSFNTSIIHYNSWFDNVSFINYVNHTNNTIINNLIKNPDTSTISQIVRSFIYPELAALGFLSAGGVTTFMEQPAILTTMLQAMQYPDIHLSALCFRTSLFIALGLAIGIISNAFSGPMTNYANNYALAS